MHKFQALEFLHETSPNGTSLNGTHLVDVPIKEPSVNGLLPPMIQCSADYKYFLTEALPVILWVAYADGYVDYPNDHWTNFTGLTPEASQSNGWTAAVHPDDLETCLSCWAESLRRGTEYDVQLRLRRDSDGAYRRHRCRAVPKTNSQNQVFCWFGSCINVEDQFAPDATLLSQHEIGDAQSKGAILDENALAVTLHESQDRYQLVSANTPGVIYQFALHPDASMEFLFISPGSRTLFNIEPEEIESDAGVLLAMIAPESRGAFYASVMDSAKNLTPWYWEGWAIISSGQRKWITCSSSPVPRANGDIVWDGLLMDATAQKTANIQIEMQRLQLEDANLRLGEANRKLEMLATHDGLTGLKNRRNFQERLCEELQRHARFEVPFPLLLLDVDKFKQFNDSFGHMAGDEVLRIVARLLKESVREIDVAARYGGEEFAVILPRTDEIAALALAERVRRTIEAHPWIEHAVTVSIGVATTTPQSTAEQLIHAADEGLYHSKEQGRNCVTHARNLAFAGRIPALPQTS